MKNYPNIGRLINIMHQLRQPDGCPWDRKQDITSLRPYIIEEAFETVEALDNLDVTNKESVQELVKELGDLLLQVVFVSQIASETALFTLDDVAAAISDKLVERHPHVFGTETAKDADEVLLNWNKIKKSKEQKKYLLDGIPQAMPAVNLAQRYSSRAASIGFDWKTWEDCLPKVYEEIDELKEAIAENDKEHIESEAGDALFAVINLARKLDVDSEKALKKAALRFKRRFEVMEELNSALIDGETPLEEMEDLWQQAKKILRENKK